MGFSLAFVLSTAAQDAPPAPRGQRSAQGPGGGPGQRGGWGGGFGGSGVMGTVTAVAADHYTIKTDEGVAYTVQFSVNTRIVKQTAGMRGPGGGEGRGQGGAPPQTIKPTDIKVGDAISAFGETDAANKSIGAVAVVQLDAETAKQMREMRANYGRTWLMGKVTAINGVSVTLDGQIDHTPHTFTADENTTFRQRREPIALADLQVGEMVRVEGAVKNGSFIAATVAVRGISEGGPTMVPRSASPANPPQ